MISAVDYYTASNGGNGDFQDMTKEMVVAYWKARMPAFVCAE
jgi:hypothetical protein